MKAAPMVLLVALLGEVALAASPFDSYPDYFEQNPKVANHTLSELSYKEQVLFWTDIIELESKKNISVSIPQELQKGYFVNYTENEAREILAAKYAHAVWLDKNRLVPWHLEDYSHEELEVLFNRSSIFEILDGGFSHLVGQPMISDFSPSEIYEIQRKFIGKNQNETIFALLEDYRSNFRHGLSTEPLKETSQSLHAILTTVDRYDHRVSYSGCQSMARIIEMSLRNLNIPAYQGYTRYAGGGHSALFLPTMDKILLHGDDIYNAGKKEMPFEDILIDASLYEKMVGRCNQKDRACNDEALFGWEARKELLYADRTKYHIQNCCRRDFGYESCNEYVDHGFSNARYLTQKEKNGLVNDLLAAC